MRGLELLTLDSPRLHLNTVCTVQYIKIIILKSTLLPVNFNHLGYVFKLVPSNASQLGPFYFTYSVSRRRTYVSCATVCRRRPRLASSFGEAPCIRMSPSSKIQLTSFFVQYRLHTYIFYEYIHIYVHFNTCTVHTVRIYTTMQKGTHVKK
jgi:hypothetical protein